MCNNPLCHNRPNPDGSPCSLCAQLAPAPLPSVEDRCHEECKHLNDNGCDCDKFGVALGLEDVGADGTAWPHRYVDCREQVSAPAVFESTKEAVRLAQVSLSRDMLTHGGAVCMVPSWVLRVLVGCGQRQQEPAPAPLPESDDVAEALAEISAAGLKGVAVGLRLHIKGLTRRLVEAEADKAKLNNTVEMVKHGLNGPWEPGADVALAAKEAGGALQSIGLLRAIGDWSMYSELPAKVAAIQIRAEAAEARIADLEAQLSGVGVRQYREAVERLHKAEAFKARVLAWARGRCDFCGNISTQACQTCCHYAPGAAGTDNWTLPKKWEVGE